MNGNFRSGPPAGATEKNAAGRSVHVFCSVHFPYDPPRFATTHASYSLRGINRSDALLMQ